MHNFKKLNIWQKSMDLVTQIYVLTADYPSSEILWNYISNKKICGFNTIKHFRRICEIE